MRRRIEDLRAQTYTALLGQLCDRRSSRVISESFRARERLKAIVRRRFDLHAEASIKWIGSAQLASVNSSATCITKGYKIGDKDYKVHLDGFNLLPFLSGKEAKCPRDGFIYWSDDGDCMALPMGDYKVVFVEQRSKGLDVWREPLSPMRIPKFFDLRADPFERGGQTIGSCIALYA